MDFVRCLADRFEELSIERGKKLENELGFNPWECMGGRLTISAGVLFAKTSLPLHSSIPFAESLLANAKRSLRDLMPPVSVADKSASDDSPTHYVTQSAVDWESVTDTMVDNSVTRRNRELVFFDSDINTTLRLTRRPYAMGKGQQAVQEGQRVLPHVDQLFDNQVRTLRNTPNSFRAELAEMLRRPWAERCAYLFAIAKERRYQELASALEIPPDLDLPKNSRWFPVTQHDEDLEDGGGYTTDVIDAITLLEEDHRMNQSTATTRGGHDE